MKPLNHYKKINDDKLDAAVTSVTLEKRHLQFIRRLNLNLSRMVRDLIDDLIQKEGQKNEDQK